MLNIIDPGNGLIDGTYALVFSSGAADGTATVTGGKIVSYVITTAGTYTAEPTVTLTGINSGVFGIVIAAKLVGTVTSITVNAGGTGYTSDPTVTILDPGADGTHPNCNGHDVIMERIGYDIEKIIGII
jgi:hypothetical protein